MKKKRSKEKSFENEKISQDVDAIEYATKILTEQQEETGRLESELLKATKAYIDEKDIEAEIKELEQKISDEIEKQKRAVQRTIEIQKETDNKRYTNEKALKLLGYKKMIEKQEEETIRIEGESDRWKKKLDHAQELRAKAEETEGILHPRAKIQKDKIREMKNAQNEKQTQNEIELEAQKRSHETEEEQLIRQGKIEEEIWKAEQMDLEFEVRKQNNNNESERKSEEERQNQQAGRIGRLQVEINLSRLNNIERRQRTKLEKLEKKRKEWLDNIERELDRRLNRMKSQNP